MSEKGREVAAREEGFFSGPRTEMVARRERSKDNGDGTATLAFLVAAEDLPKDLTSSPLHSVWSILVRTAGQAHRMVGTREAVHDKDDGKALLRFSVFTSTVGTAAVYGNRNQDVVLTVNLTARENNHPFMTTAAARNGVMQRCAIMCGEPEFGEWIADQCRKDGYPVLPEPGEGPAEEPGAGAPKRSEAMAVRAVEHLYRVARVHSRADVLDSNAAAGRMEDVIRRYRSFVWDARDRRRRSGVVG